MIQNSAAYKSNDTTKMIRDMQEGLQQQMLLNQVDVNPYAEERDDLAQYRQCGVRFPIKNVPRNF